MGLNLFGSLVVQRSNVQDKIIEGVIAMIRRERSVTAHASLTWFTVAGEMPVTNLQHWPVISGCVSLFLSVCVQAPRGGRPGAVKESAGDAGRPPDVPRHL